MSTSRRSSKARRNQIAFITIDARSGERTIVWDRDDRLAYKPDEAPVEFGALGTRVASRCSRSARVRCVWRKLAREAGTIVSADIDNVYDGLPELLPLIDILIGSKEFPRSRDRDRQIERAALSS